MTLRPALGGVQPRLYSETLSENKTKETNPFTEAHLTLKESSAEGATFKLVLFVFVFLFVLFYFWGQRNQLEERVEGSGKKLYWHEAFPGKTLHISTHSL